MATTRALRPITHQSDRSITLHLQPCQDVKMLCKEDKTRKLKEAIIIYKDGPVLNKPHHPSFVVQKHIDLTGHSVTFNHVKMCKEYKTRRVKEAIIIYKDGPALNRPQPPKIRGQETHRSDKSLSHLQPCQDVV